MRAVQVERQEFGRLPSGQAVDAAVLTSPQGMMVRVISLGAAIQSVVIPGRDGSLAEVTYGYPDLQSYLDYPQYCGATVGRVANRIAGARFVLDGKAHKLAGNDGGNTLHGGQRGFDKQNWRFEQLTADSVTFALTSRDGDEGYPGTLEVSATYRLDGQNRLSVDYAAVTDAPSLVNLSNHVYWNLAGAASGRSAMGHRLSIAADHFLPVGEGLIPTGELRAVAGTVFDFRQPQMIGARVRDWSEPQLRVGRGYDHNWVLGQVDQGQSRTCATLVDPINGRRLSIDSNRPGLQFYSGNFFDGTVAGHGGQAARMGDFVALEPQGFPDAANQPRFPSIRLDPGQTYHNLIGWTFDIAEEQNT